MFFTEQKEICLNKKVVVVYTYYISTFKWGGEKISLGATTRTPKVVKNQRKKSLGFCQKSVQSFSSLFYSIYKT